MPTDVEFMRRLRADFAAEAAERTQALDAALIELQRVQDEAHRRSLIDAVFREAHSIKGAARAVDIVEIEGLCQSLEDVFARWKRESFQADPEQFDVLHRGVDLIRELSIPGGGTRGSQVTATRRGLAAIIASARPQAIPALQEPPEPPAEQPAAEPPRPLRDTVRIDARKLDAVLLEAEELLVTKLAAQRSARSIRRLASEFERWRRAWAHIQPELGQAEGALSTSAKAFLSETDGTIRLIGNRLSSLQRALASDARNLSGRVDELLEDAKQLVMLPFSSIVEGFPRLARDLARSEGKDLDLAVQGSNVELDKRVLQALRDPLIHLVRNAVAHGVEAPGFRGSKPARSKVEISVALFGRGEAEVRISDDGAGIELGRVRTVAVQSGIISEEDAAHLDEERTLALLFRPEFSTSRTLTTVSGRGLGLTIVRDTVERLGGRVLVESRPGAGTTFRLFVPLTLATYHAIIVAVARQRFVIPSGVLERVIRTTHSQVRRVENRDVVEVERTMVPFVRLESMLALSPVTTREEPPHGRAYPTLILGTAGKRAAIAVDSVIGEQEVLAKPLNKPLIRVRHVAGATILGDGCPAIILHPADLIRTARTFAPVVASAVEAPSAPRKPILVVEDSITSRSLLKGILEHAGFAVSTAVDGKEALMALQTNEFGLVVSDIEMPRLDGFGLTAAIRADPRLHSLPVILVTCRESPNDRERGMDAGANAYLAKSSFEGSDLLAAVDRFL